jgi:hypothetical protein
MELYSSRQYSAYTRFNQNKNVLWLKMSVLLFSLSSSETVMDTSSSVVYTSATSFVRIFEDRVEAFQVNILSRVSDCYRRGIGLTTGFIGSHTVTHNYSVYTL